MKNKRIITLVAALLLVSGVVAGCAGFDLGDLIRAPTPPDIQQQTGLPSSLPLNEAQVQYQAWYEDVQRAGTQWRNKIERAAEIRAMLGQLTMQGLDNLGPTLAGVPVLGPALPAATGLLAYILGVSGRSKEKEKSYNAGLKKGQQMTSPPTPPTLNS
ncbi:MAG: hypothetical protein GVY28_12505 [Alphaproteobacteria bacterium]|jgi:hypothetical protein|nr:hypothetical protein [Alphaproteobacteria bacterium]